MDEVGIFQKIRELFDEAPKRMCDETGRAELERELEEGINRDITIMLGYQPPILIKPVIALNKEARSAVLKELRKRPTVKASAIFTGKHGSMGFHAGRFYAVTIVKRRGEVVLIAPDDGLKCPYSSLNAMLNNWHILLVIFDR